MMSKTTKQRNRVEVRNLQQSEKELKNREAESVKGGGGAKGGVVYIQRYIPPRGTGEEIPS